MEMQGKKIAKTSFEIVKCESSYFVLFQNYHAAVCTGQRGIGIRTDMYIDRTELRVQK